MPADGARPVGIKALGERAAIYATRAHGAGTRRAYRSGWRAYEAWCCSLRCEPLDGNPDTVAKYVAYRADAGAAGGDGLSMSSLGVALAAIRSAHRLSSLALDLRDPRLAMAGERITRAKGSRALMRKREAEG